MRHIAYERLGRIHNDPEPRAQASDAAPYPEPRARGSGERRYPEPLHPEPRARGEARARPGPEARRSAVYVYDRTRVGVVQARVSQNGTFSNNALLSGISMGRDAFYRQSQ